MGQMIAFNSGFYLSFDDERYELRRGGRTFETNLFTDNLSQSLLLGEQEIPPSISQPQNNQVPPVFLENNEQLLHTNHLTSSAPPQTTDPIHHNLGQINSPTAAQMPTHSSSHQAIPDLQFTSVDLTQNTGGYDPIIHPPNEQNEQQTDRDNEIQPSPEIIVKQQESDPQPRKTKTTQKRNRTQPPNKKMVKEQDSQPQPRKTKTIRKNNRTQRPNNQRVRPYDPFKNCLKCHLRYQLQFLKEKMKQRVYLYEIYGILEKKVKKSCSRKDFQLLYEVEEFNKLLTDYFNSGRAQKDLSNSDADERQLYKTQIPTLSHVLKCKKFAKIRPKSKVDLQNRLSRQDFR